MSRCGEFGDIYDGVVHGDDHGLNGCGGTLVYVADVGMWFGVSFCEWRCAKCGKKLDEQDYEEIISPTEFKRIYGRPPS